MDLPIMLTELNAYRYRAITPLIDEFNKTAEEDEVRRLFYLQKINYYLNKMIMDKSLFNWVDAAGDSGWQANLLVYGINSDASFFLKGFQFAKAIAASVTVSDADLVDLQDKDEYQLKQMRDELFSNNKTFDECQDQFVAINCRLNQLAENNNLIKSRIDKQSVILGLANAKINSVKGNKTGIQPTRTEYITEQLGARKVNNYNFKFKMRDYDEDLVFRVEDRNNLASEYELESFPVSIYFGDDSAVFMMQFKSEDEVEEGDDPFSEQAIYKPVVLSQFANQASLKEVAQNFKNKSHKIIANNAKYYFSQINDFAEKLMQAGVYHPDIKLSNFLVHNKEIIVSDRKTFIKTKNARADEIRSTFSYAPPQYADCINDSNDGYKQPIAHNTIFDMEQFMAYQIGMALNEFLLLTQDDNLPETYGDSDFNAADYFDKPSTQIINLSLLARELTHHNEAKRLSIKQFQSLIGHINLNTGDFAIKVEAELLEITESELKKAQKILKKKRIGKKTMNVANQIFSETLNRETTPVRLNELTEKLAIKCYRSYSKSYFAKYSQVIEDALFQGDWNSATWYRKLFHVVTLGFYRVDKVTDVSSLKDIIDVDDDQFQSHMLQLHFLPLNEFDNLGKDEARHFIQYLNANLKSPLSSLSAISYQQLKNGSDESDTMKIDESDTMKIDESDTMKIDEYDTMKIDESDTMKIDESDTMKIDESDTMKINESDTMKINESDTMKINESDTMKINESDTIESSDESTSNSDEASSSTQYGNHGFFANSADKASGAAKTNGKQEEILKKSIHDIVSAFLFK